MDKENINDKYVIYSAGEFFYALPLEQIKMTIIENDTKIKWDKNKKTGLMHYNNKKYSIYKFDLKEDSSENIHCIVLVKANKKEFALIFEEIMDIETIPDSLISKNPDKKSGFKCGYISGFATVKKKAVFIINLSEFYIQQKG